MYLGAKGSMKTSDSDLIRASSVVVVCERWRRRSVRGERIGEAIPDHRNVKMMESKMLKIDKTRTSPLRMLSSSDEE